MIDDLAQYVAQLPVDKFWLCFVVAVGGSLFSFYLAFRFFWRYRVMQNTPTALIRSAAQGYNEFEGTAKLMPGEPIIAPLTKLECVWFHYKVEERQSHYTRHGTRTTWVLRDSGISDGLFTLLGAAGEAIVDPDDAEVTHSKMDVWYGSTPSPSAGPRGFSSSSWIMGRRYQYSEKRVHNGDPVYILGNLSSIREQALPNSTEELAVILKRWKAFPEAILSRFDANKDGRIDAEEWTLAVDVAKQHAAKNASELDAVTSDNRKPYLISAKRQKSLISHYQVRSWGVCAYFLF